MEWIEADKNPPPFNHKVLGYDFCRIYICYRKEESEYNEHWCICEDQDCSCTGCTGAIRYWMPLPEKPKDKQCWISFKDIPPPDDIKGLIFLYDDGTQWTERRDSFSGKRSFRLGHGDVIGWRFIERGDPNEKSILC